MVLVATGKYRALAPLHWVDHRYLHDDLQWWLSGNYQAATVVLRQSRLSSPQTAQQGITTAVEDLGNCEILVLGLAGYVSKFVRRTGDFYTLALPGTVPGRPNSALTFSAIASSLNRVRHRYTGVLLCADLVPLGRSDTAASVGGLIDGVAEAIGSVLDSPLDVLLSIAVPTTPPELTCHRGLAAVLGECAAAGRAITVSDMVEQAARRIRSGGGTAHTLHQVSTNTVVPASTAERLPDFVRADLFATDAGSRLDAVVELAELGETGNRFANRCLRRLQTHDPEEAVRSYATTVRHRSRYPSSRQLREVGVMSDSVYLQAEQAPAVPDLIPQPSGRIPIGTDAPVGFPSNQPRHPVRIAAFRLGRTVVTNRQYLAFLIATGGACPPHWAGSESTCVGPDLPVVMVSWFDAMRYCVWLTEHLRTIGALAADEQILLPSEAEWECAASNGRGDPYPWGSSAGPGRANTRATDIGAVVAPGQFSPQGDSFAGCQDLIGNVWEWTRSVWGRGGRTPDFVYPYDSADGRETTDAGSGIRRVIRGGAYYYATECANAYVRNQMPGGNQHPAGGFRVAALRAP